MVVSIKYLLTVIIWGAQVLSTIKLNTERECILFGIANVITNFFLILAVLVIWRMERGRSRKLDADAEDAFPMLPSNGIVARLKVLFLKRRPEERGRKETATTTSKEKTRETEAAP